MELIKPTCFVQNLGWIRWETSLLELFQACAWENEVSFFRTSCLIAVASGFLS